MSAEQTAHGLFAWNKKRDEDFAAACAAMLRAIPNSAINAFQSSNISRGSDDETVDLLKNATQTQNPLPLTNMVATKILDEVKKLQKENPLNTKFLTEVLNVTANFIRNPNQENLGKYQTMQEQVAIKYGRYSKLTLSLLGLPAAIIIGGMIGATFLCVAFPALTPFLATGICMVLLAGTAASTVPANKAHDIAGGWQSVKTALGR